MVFACSLSTGVAYADGGLVDVSVSQSTFDSSSNAYGPWIVEDFVYRFPPDSSAGIDITNRHASDRFNPNTERSITADKYFRFGPRASGYASASFGSAAPFAQQRYAAELDIATTKRLVLAAGGAFGTLYGLGSMRQVMLGADYYAGNAYASFRYRPTWSTTLGNTQGYSLAFAFGQPKNVMNTFRIGAGGENDTSLINPLNPTIVDEREFSIGYSLRKWTTPRTGYHLDISHGTLSRTGGAQLYSQTTLGAGIFFVP